MSKKIKSLENKIQNLENELFMLNKDFNKFRLNLKFRDYLLKTDFFGSLSSLAYKNKLENTMFFNDDNASISYTFDDVKKQIKAYDFESVYSFIAVLSQIEEQEKNALENTDKYDYKIDNAKNYSGKKVYIQNTNNVKNKINRSKRKSAVDFYQINNPNEYFIKNIDIYYSRLKYYRYKLTKSQIVTLVNIILKQKTKENIIKTLKISESTLGNYLSILAYIGIIERGYKGLY